MYCPIIFRFIFLLFMIHSIINADDLSVHDLAIINGRIIDPETKTDMVGNIAINGEKISLITQEKIQAKIQINAENLVVSPGFIDICTPGRPGNAEYAWNIGYWKVTDGVTTALFMHDGTGNITYFKEMLKEKNHLINYGFSTRTIDYLYKGYSLEKKLELICENLDNGALGISASPEYTPLVKTDELLAYAQLAHHYRVPFFLHLRHSAESNELDGIKEAIFIAENSKARVHIFHIASTGGTFNMTGALNLIQRARKKGYRITADLYPYTFWMTYIDSARFNRGWQTKYNLDYEDLYLINNKYNLKTYLNKEMFLKFRKLGGLVVVPKNTISMQKTIVPALKKDFVYIASDGSYNVGPQVKKIYECHPRGCGNFSKAVRVGLNHKISLSNILKKMTLDPANLMQEVSNRFRLLGRLQPGCFADITIFDPGAIDNQATVLKPAQESLGIKFVIVNGKIIVSRRKLFKRNAGIFIERENSE